MICAEMLMSVPAVPSSTVKVRVAPLRSSWPGFVFESPFVMLAVPAVTVLVTSPWSTILPAVPASEFTVMFGLAVPEKFKPPLLPTVRVPGPPPGPAAPKTVFVPPLTLSTLKVVLP